MRSLQRRRSATGSPWRSAISRSRSPRRHSFTSSGSNGRSLFRDQIESRRLAPCPPLTLPRFARVPPSPRQRGEGRGEGLALLINLFETPLGLILARLVGAGLV